MRSVSKSVFKSRDFRGAFRLAQDFREKKPTRVRRVNLNVPKTLMVMGHVEFIGYRTTHGEQLVLYKHDFAPGSRPQLAAGPKRNQLFIVGGRYRVTDRGIVDLDASGREIDEPQHGAFLDNDRSTNARRGAKFRLVYRFKDAPDVDPDDYHYPEEYSEHKTEALADARRKRLEKIHRLGLAYWRIEPVE